jgi:hypothetical protein
MDILITTLRWIHIAAGTLALFVAPAAMLTVKGGRAHRTWGTIYFWSMAVVGATAVALGLWRPQIFLTLVAVFSFYMAFSGYRALRRKRPAQGQGPRVIDWAAAWLTFAVGAALVVLGVLRPGPTWERVGIVPVVFGALGMVLSGLDIRKFLRPPADRNDWWFAHMAGMLGSYIATVSAFSVVNFDFLPIAVRWLWATAIGTPLITIWVRDYKRRFRRGAPAPVAVTPAGEVSC